MLSRAGLQSEAVGILVQSVRSDGSELVRLRAEALLIIDVRS